MTIDRDDDGRSRGNPRLGKRFFAKIVLGSKQMVLLEDDKRELEIIEHSLRLYREGHSYGEIARRLTAMGYVGRQRNAIRPRLPEQICKRAGVATRVLPYRPRKRAK